MKKQIEVAVCDFCGSDKEVQSIFGKDMCFQCFQKFTAVSQSLYSESLTKEIEEIIKEYDLNCSVEEFQDKVDWYWLSKHQKLSREFRNKWKHKLN